MKNIQNSYTHTFIPSSYTHNPPKVRSWRGSLLQAIRAWFVFWYSWKVHIFRHIFVYVFSVSVSLCHCQFPCKGHRR